jgi:glycosyltransferase involved in cell wall biosynthesis
MRIAIIGPSHPYKSGIVQQTTELAHRLAALGHDVEVLGWKSQFPKLLYPGVLLPEDQPELPIFPKTKRLLSWNNPLSWRQVGRYASQFDQVIFIWWVPTFQGPIYSTIRHHLKKSVYTTALCHNVLPHEGKPGDKRLTQYFLKQVDQLVVHTQEQADLAKTLTDKPVAVVALPPLFPGWSSNIAENNKAPKHHLLFFGIVRKYKGVDILLRALAKLPDVSLTIAGEFWGGPRSYEAMITKLGLGDRVTIQAGYIAAEAIPRLFAEADALVLPYRSATGTSNVQLGFAYGIPVISSDLRVLTEQIKSGVDGLTFRAGDADALASTIQQFYQPEIFKKLMDGVPSVPIDSLWQSYLDVIAKPKD